MDTDPKESLSTLGHCLDVGHIGPWEPVTMGMPSGWSECGNAAWEVAQVWLLLGMITFLFPCSMR